MPSHAASSPEKKQLYIDGHFCYAYKIGIVTNGLGMIRHLVFYNTFYQFPSSNNPIVQTKIVR